MKIKLEMRTMEVGVCEYVDFWNFLDESIANKILWREQ